jgi:hypothetical protein
MIKAVALSAFLLAGLCAGTARAEGAASAGAPRQCFSTRDIRNFAAQDDYTINLNIARRDVYQLKTIINCPDVGLRGGLDFKAASEQVCGPLDMALVTRTPIGPRECAVKSIRKLTAEEVAALPKRARP